MTNENFTASSDRMYKGSRGRRALKWIVASVVAMSLFGTGFAIAYASSRRTLIRDKVPRDVSLLQGNAFSTNQSSPAYYSPITPVVTQRNVAQQSLPVQPSNTQLPSLPPSTTNQGTFPGASNSPYSYYVPYQPVQSYTSVFTPPLGVLPTDSNEEQVANQATSEILGKLRNARGGDRDELMEKLRSAVSDQFDVRHALQAQQIEEVEKQLQKSKELHKKRAEKKDEIVSRRIGQLLNDPDELDWNRNIIGQNNMPRNGYSVPPSIVPPNSYPQYNSAPGWSAPGYSTSPGMQVQVPTFNSQPQYPRQYAPGVPPQAFSSAPSQAFPESTSRPPQQNYRSEDASPTPRSSKQPTLNKPVESPSEPKPLFDAPNIQPPQVPDEASGDGAF